MKMEIKYHVYSLTKPRILKTTNDRETAIKSQVILSKIYEREFRVLEEPINETSK